MKSIFGNQCINNLLCFLNGRIIPFVIHQILDIFRFSVFFIFLDVSSLSNHLQSALGLQFRPVAVVRVDAQPEDIRRFDGVVPSGCTFWRRAEHDLFYAAAEDHMGCLIGAMVLGFELSESQTDELMGLVGDMCAVAYLEEDEVYYLGILSST